MVPTLVMAAVGAVVGFFCRRSVAKLARVKDAEGIRLPWPELLGAVLFGAAGWRVGFEVARIPVYWFTAALLATMVTDFRYKLIPDRVTFPGSAFGVVASAMWPAWISSTFHHDVLLDWMNLGPGPLAGFALGLGGAASGFLFFEGSRRFMGRLANMEVMGMGDSKLTMLMGAFLGPLGVLLALFPSMICGVVIGVIYTRIMKSPHFPFGPALGLGGYLTLLWPQMVSGMLGWAQEFGASMDRGVLIFSQIILLAIVVLMMLRVRKRSKEYTEMIEKDYDRLEEDK